jgi:hypothetical protein
MSEASQGDRMVCPQCDGKGTWAFVFAQKERKDPCFTCRGVKYLPAEDVPRFIAETRRYLEGLEHELAERRRWLVEGPEHELAERRRWLETG